MTQTITPLRPLSPQFDARQHEIYVQHLQLAIEDPTSRNIALAGYYGTGKSSILKEISYQFHDRVVEISLITLTKVTSNTVGNPNASEHAVPNQLQREIIKQLLYQEHPHRMPLSRLRRIAGLHWRDHLKLATTIGCLAFLLLTAVGSITSIIELDKKDTSSISLLFFSIFALIIVSLLLPNLAHGRLALRQISAGPATISVSEPLSYFDQYHDEIVYFFKTSKRNIVLFEDIDRFDNLEIFEALHSLNRNINNALKTANRGLITYHLPVRFVYAVKDSIFWKPKPSTFSNLPINARSGSAESFQEWNFRCATNRTKFFDVIVPIVPFITHSNSNELFEKVQSAPTLGNQSKHLYSCRPLQLVSEKSLPPPDAVLRNIIARHIVDMRLLKNIFNEYSVFSSVMQSQIQNLNLKESNLFAMIVFKNFYADDFENIRFGKSRLDEIFDISTKSNLSDESEEPTNSSKCPGTRLIVESSQLCADLIRHEYIDANFALYASLFHGTTLSAKMMNFIIHHVERSTPNLYQEFSANEVKQLLDSGRFEPEQFIDTGFINLSILNGVLKLSSENYGRAEEYAEALIRSLRDGDGSRNGLLKAFAGQITEKPSAKSINQLSQVEYQNFYRLFLRDNPNGLNRLFEQLNFDRDTLLATLEQVLLVLPDEELTLSDELKTYLHQHIDDFRTLKALSTEQNEIADDGYRLSSDLAYKIVEIFKKAGARTRSLNALTPVLKDKFRDERLYVVNTENLSVALEHDGTSGEMNGFSLNAIQDASIEHYQHVLEHLDEYLVLMSLSSHDAITDSARLVSILEDVYDRHGIANPSIVEQIAKHAVHTENIDLHGVNEALFRILTASNHVNFNTQNIRIYLDAHKKIDVDLAEFIIRQFDNRSSDKPVSQNVIELSKALLIQCSLLELTEEQKSLISDSECIGKGVEALPVLGIELIPTLVKHGIAKDDEATYSKLLDCIVDGTDERWTYREHYISVSTEYPFFMVPDLLGEDLYAIAESQAIPLNKKEAILARYKETNSWTPSQNQAVICLEEHIQQQNENELRQTIRNLHEAANNIPDYFEKANLMAQTFSDPNNPIYQINRALADPNNPINQINRALADPNNPINQINRALADPNNPIHQINRALTGINTHSKREPSISPTLFKQIQSSDDLSVPERDADISSFREETDIKIKTYDSDTTDAFLSDGNDVPTGDLPRSSNSTPTSSGDDSDI